MVKKTADIQEDNGTPSPWQDIFFILDIGLIFVIICVVAWVADKLLGGKLGL